jgi:hypothetical protein
LVPAPLVFGYGRLGFDHRTEGQKMRNLLVVLSMLLCSATSAVAQVSIGVGLPGVSIGINLPVYPQLVAVPGYPVYYAPQLNSNYFFYDGMYWVYQQDNWYASSWYNGPWGLVAPEVVPLYVLRIPVRYYRRPPVYFRGWASDAPPRWGEHWGNTWEQRRQGWDNWNRSYAPAPAPLPVYQRQYSGNRYPRVEQQQVLQTQNYRYQPQDAVVQQHYQAQRVQSTPPPGTAPPSSRGQPPQTGGVNVQRPVTVEAPPQRAGSSVQRHPQQPQQGVAQQQQGAPQRQTQQAPQAAVQRQAQQPPQAVQRQAQPPPQAAVQRQGQQPPQQAAQHEQQGPRSQGADHGPKGKEPAEESKQGQEKGHDKRD